MNKAFPLKPTLIAVAYAIAGSLIYYLWGYKDNMLIRGVSLSLSAGGWLYMGDNVKKAYVRDKSDWYRKISINLAFAVIVLMNILICVVAAGMRVDNILSRGKTNTTIATVTEMENYRTKNGLRHYAIINYQAGNDNITEHISNSNGEHVVGEKLEVRYAVDHPDMFIVLEAVSTP